MVYQPYFTCCWDTSIFMNAKPKKFSCVYSFANVFISWGFLPLAYIYKWDLSSIVPQNSTFFKILSCLFTSSTFYIYYSINLVKSQILVLLYIPQDTQGGVFSRLTGPRGLLGGVCS